MPAKSTTLTLHLKGKYFDAIVAGDKQFEFRKKNDYWALRIEGREFEKILLQRGYPTKDDPQNNLVLPWRGYKVTHLQHDEFGPDPIQVYAIRVAPFEQGQCPECKEWFDVEWFDELPPGGFWWRDNSKGGGCPGCGTLVCVESECNFRKGSQ